MKRILVGVFGAILAFSAQAGNERAVRRTVEASLQVTGEVVIAPDGSLQSYTLDGQDTLQADVTGLLARYLPACVFDVVTASGKPETVKARMSLQLVARQIEDGRAVMSVRDSVFLDPDTPQYITKKKMSPPTYPANAGRAGFTGIVYVVLRLNPDGSVAEAHVEQVNMTVVAPEADLKWGRKLLAQASLKQARDWTFAVAPELVAKPDPISVRVPVEFLLGTSASPPTKWRQYVPGPHAPIPWEKRRVNAGVGAMTPGQLYPLDSTIQLRNPPAAGS